MARLIRALLIEDSRADAEIILLELRRGGFEPVLREDRNARGDESNARRTGLGHHPLRLRDAALQWPGSLEDRQEMDIDVPFIVVTGQVGEETAIDDRESGSQRLRPKGKSVRLVPAIQRELKDARHAPGTEAGRGSLA